ncbi:MAG: hypothetical protein ACI8RZ_006685 [Myxococcota bacterium]|jgi:hypothetical protein
MQPFRTAYQATVSAIISGGAFGLMGFLFLLSPPQDDAVSFETAPAREVVYAADVSAMLESMAAEELPLEPETIPESIPEPVEALAAADSPSEPAIAPIAEPRAVARPARRVIAERHRVRRGAAAQLTAESTPKKKRNCVEGTDSITELGPDRYQIERDLIDYYAGDMREAMTLASVYWYREEGDVVGFKVRRIKCGSVLHQAGFRNGDVIHSINGREVTTIPQALAAYRKLRRKRKLEVVLTRRTGDTVSLRYKLT